MAVGPFEVVAGAPDMVSGRPLESGFGRRVHAVAQNAKIAAKPNEAISTKNQPTFELWALVAMATSDTMLLRVWRPAGFERGPPELGRSAGRGRILTRPATRSHLCHSPVR